MENLIVIILSLLFYFRGIIIYLRSGLKGEFIRSLGIFIFMLSLSFGDFALIAVGVVVFYVGMLALMSNEYEYWKEIFGSLTYYERIIGTIPQLLDENEFRRAFIKVIAVAIGIIFISIIFEIFKKSIANDIAETINLSIIVGAGIFFIFYTVLKKMRQSS